MSEFTLVHYRGFNIKSEDQLRVYLENTPVTEVPSVDVAKRCIDFYHDAASANFKVTREREAARKQKEADNAGPEPDLRSANGRPSIEWIKWYRATTGCGLKEAFVEATNRVEGRTHE